MKISVAENRTLLYPGTDKSFFFLNQNLPDKLPVQKVPSCFLERKTAKASSWLFITN